MIHQIANVLLEQLAVLPAHFFWRAFEDQNARAVDAFETTIPLAREHSALAGCRTERWNFFVEPAESHRKEMRQMRACHGFDFVVFCGLQLPFLAWPGIGELRIYQLDLDVHAFAFGIFDAQRERVILSNPKLQGKSAQVEVADGLGFGRGFEDEAFRLTDFLIGKRFDVSEKWKELKLLRGNGEF